MRKLLGSALAAALLLTAAAPADAQRKRAGDGDKGPALSAFSSDRQLRQFLRKRAGEDGGYGILPPPPPPPPPPAGAPPAAAGATGENAEVMVTANRVTGNDLMALSPSSITNNQEAAVDEGGIVKVHGEHLVVLRRGRLFTISLAGGAMRPVDSIEAFPPGVSGAGDWYDEMLVSGDRIVVVGFSYDRGGTEINRFRIDSAGRLRFEDAYHLRSDDYYSSRNYASRLIGDTLIFYAPLYLEWDEDPLESLPGLRRWREGGEDAPFKRIARARDIYVPGRVRGSREAVVDTLHTVTRCDLTRETLDCTARGILGAESRTFYVSPDAVYLWVDEPWDYDSDREGEGFLFRLPIGAERPRAVGVRGAPVDQFSFDEDGERGLLNVLLRAEGGGDAMWSPEVSDGDVALLRVRLDQFGDGSRAVPGRQYRPLPRLPGSSWNFHNRFAGDHVLYAGGELAGEPERSRIVAVPVAGGKASELDLSHGVDRIELLGRDAIAIGGGPGGLGFTAIDLPAAARPALGARYVHPDSAQGETRSHAFFFRPDPRSPDGASGILGFPVARPLEPRTNGFLGNSAAMLFLRRLERQFSPAGELEAHAAGARDDGCKASCVDWYGNARPIFLGDRTFALLGYELVEGKVEDGRIRETARIDFSPPAPQPAR